MNPSPTEEVIEEPPTKHTPISERITKADMPLKTKELARNLLDGRVVGVEFIMTTGTLRKMVKGVTNVDFLKHLRKLKAKGLIAYSINNPPTIVTIKFLD